MFRVYSVHGFNLGTYEKLEDAQSLSDGWQILDLVGRLLFERMSFDYRDKRWYTVNEELTPSPTRAERE